LPRHFLATSTLNQEELLDLFERRLAHYGAKAVRTSASKLEETVAEILSSRNKHRILVPPGVPDSWLPGGTEFIRDTGLDYNELDRVDGVLTGCEVAIALSGSFVLQGNSGEGHDVQGRRAATLLPDYHLCIVRQEDIVELLPEALKRLDARKTAPTTFVSGSSATVDIEMKRVRGVHGPRTLDVIIVVAAQGST
jgi:L-lactate dehydrogenase complex protein LldG